MKTITIGRGPENMVTLDDPKISRHHALLRCYPLGKIEIVDISQNGTFVNGMQIASNKPYPLTRKDIVIFAHAEKLDWKRVPAPYRRIKYLIMLAIALIAAIIIGSYFYARRDTSHTGIDDAPPPTPTPVGVSVPGCGLTPADSIKKTEKKSDDRFIFPQNKKTNSKGRNEERKKETSKTQKEDKDVPSKKEDVQEQSVLL